MKTILYALAMFITAAAFAVDVPPGSFPPKPGAFVYRAKVIRVVDGATIDLQFDLGLDASRNERGKFRRVYATPEAMNAGKVKQFLQRRLSPGEKVTVQTKKDERDIRGNYLVEVWDGVGNVNDAVLKFMKENGVTNKK